jgi:hypothetical protein
MRTSGIVGVTLIGLLSSALAPIRAAGQSTPCLGPDAISAVFLARLDSLLTLTDTGNVNWRTRLNLQATTSAQVKLVTKKVTCQAAVAAVNAARQSSEPNRKVYVFQGGPTQFAVWDPTTRDVSAEDGQLRAFLFFTSAWVYKSAVTY